MKHNKMTRMIASALALALAVGLIPASAAEEDDTQEIWEQAGEAISATSDPMLGVQSGLSEDTAAPHLLLQGENPGNQTSTLSTDDSGMYVELCQIYGLTNDEIKQGINLHGSTLLFIVFKKRLVLSQG